MSQAAPAIECRGLTKRYGSVVALDGLDLEVPAGSVFGFLGPNGAGKTTTLRILASLGRADAGSARVAGLAVGDGAANRAGLIGYLDQDPRFYGWMTAARPAGPGREAARHGWGRPPRAHRCHARHGWIGRCRPAQHRWVLRRHAAAAGIGAGDPESPAGAAAGRAGQLPRPAGPPRHAGDDPRPGRRGDRPVLDPHPQRRGARLRSGGDHRPRTGRHRQPHGRAAGPLRHADLRGRDRARRRRHARLAGRRAARGPRRDCGRAGARHAAGHRGRGRRRRRGSCWRPSARRT